MLSVAGLHSGSGGRRVWVGKQVGDPREGGRAPVLVWVRRTRTALGVHVKFQERTVPRGASAPRAAPSTPQLGLRWPQ